MATFTHTLVFQAESASEYLAMKLWVNGQGAPALLLYTIVWDDANRKLTLTYAGTRDTDWSSG